MPAPYDYTIKSTNPFLAGLQGYQMAQQQRQQAMALESQQQKMAMQQQAQQQAMAEAEMKRQKQMQFQDDVAAMPENPSSMDILNLIKKYPQMAAGYKDIQKIQSEAETKQSVMNAMTLGNYIRSGNIEGANNFLDLQIEANKNSGNDASVAGLQQIKEQLQTDPKATLISVEALAASIAGPDKFAETAQKLQETSKGRYLTPLDIKKQELENRKLGIELKNLEKKAESPDEAVFNQEEKIRKEYTAKAKNYVDSYEAYNRLRLGAEANSGQGDLALITGFMKMLDPGSVVRETEFANAQDTSGIYNRIKSMVSKWKEGDRLQPEDRQKFMNLSRQYMQAAVDQDNQVRAGYDKLIQDFNLDKGRIFQPQFKISEPKGADQASSRQAERVPIRTGTYKGRKVNQYADGSVEYAD